MMEKKLFIRVFSNELMNHGFEKKKGAWWKFGPDVVCGLELQKSDFSECFYLNLGISLRKLSPDDDLKINKCHIQISADRLISGESFESFNRALRSELEGFDDVVFLKILDQEILPLVDKFLNLPSLKLAYKLGAFKAALIFRQARELLDLENLQS